MKKSIVFSLVASVFISLVVSSNASAQSPEDAFVQDIEAYRQDMGNVALAVAVVKDNKIVYHANFGVMDLETKEPLKDNALFRIASISKSFSATSMMQLIEKGLVSLDTDVSTLAGFTVRNPKFPDTVITLEMLLSHTSSLNDREGYFTLDVINPQTNPNYKNCYNDYEPGKGYEYCNLNFNMVGTFIEKLSGERFDQYVVHHILEPLGLYGGYCVDSLDASRFVKLYNYNQAKDEMVESVDAYAPRSERIANYKFGYDTPVFSPTGGMKISACDLARYMMMHMGWGTSPDGVKIISQEHSCSMQTPRSKDENYGLALGKVSHRIPGVTLVGHTGGAYGLRSAMYFAPDRSFGLVMISSGCKVDGDGEQNIINGTLRRMYKHFIASKKIYDPELNQLTQIDDAVAKAKKEGKFVICQVGGNWCPWCLRFADFAKHNEPVATMISANFVYIHVNYDRRIKDQAAKARQDAMMVRLGNPGRFGYPVFVVLDQDGKVIHTQDSSFLEEGKGYSEDQVLRFLKAWTPSAVK